MEQTFHPVLQFNECAVIGEINHFTLNSCSPPGISLQYFPTVGSGLLMPNATSTFSAFTFRILTSIWSPTATTCEGWVMRLQERSLMCTSPGQVADIDEDSVVNYIANGSFTTWRPRSFPGRPACSGVPSSSRISRRETTMLFLIRSSFITRNSKT